VTHPPENNYFTEAERVFDQQIGQLAHVKASLADAFDDVVRLILDCRGKVVVTGIGKSGIVAHKIAATLASTGTPAVYLSAGEALHGDLGVIAADDVVLMLSQSAATTELVQMLPSVQRIGAQVVGVFGKRDTPLARACAHVLDVGVESEACPLGLAPMTSATVALVTGDALASALMKARGFRGDDFAVFHPGGSLGRRLLLRVRDVMHAGDRVPRARPSASLLEALQAMNEVNLGGVVVEEDERVRGVFTDGDLRRRILDGDSLDQKIETMMTREPLCARADARLGDALDLMERHGRQIYFVPVVDEHQRLCGVLRMHDIVG